MKTGKSVFGKIRSKNVYQVDQKRTVQCNLTVMVTGLGMDEETRQRVFEPFFTTRFYRSRPWYGRGIRNREES